MTENLALPLALNTPVEASYNDGSVFTYMPSNTSGHDGINTNTVTPRISSDIGNGYYYYNWYAATGEKGNSSSTGDIDGSICPSGWKLPYNYTINSSFSWGGLTDAYGITTNGANKSTSTDYLILKGLPFSVDMVGFYWDNTINAVGTYAGFWASSVYTAATPYRLDVSTTLLYPQVIITYASRQGFNVRCVASPLAH